ncbi:hypothetical protein I6E29_00905 [Arcanobacterium haemolyticum]|nr:hypothetical protein [Arcanobacterium haemolyticum]
MNVEVAAYRGAVGIYAKGPEEILSLDEARQLIGVIDEAITDAEELQASREADQDAAYEARVSQELEEMFDGERAD